MKATEPVDSKDLSNGGESPKQTVTKTYHQPKTMLARDMSRQHSCYASLQEAQEAKANGTFDLARCCVWHAGRLYFLCAK